MATAPSYATYLTLGGTLPEARFTAALPVAVSAVDAAIWPNAVTAELEADYQRTVCRVADLVDSPAVSAERIGNTSVSYAEVPTIGDAIRRELGHTGLLFRGL